MFAQVAKVFCILLGLVHFGHSDVIFTPEKCLKREYGLKTVNGDPSRYKQCGPTGHVWIVPCAPEMLFDPLEKVCKKRGIDSVARKPTNIGDSRNNVISSVVEEEFVFSTHRPKRPRNKIKTKKVKSTTPLAVQLTSGQEPTNRQASKPANIPAFTAPYQRIRTTTPPPIASESHSNLLPDSDYKSTEVTLSPQYTTSPANVTEMDILNRLMKIVDEHKHKVANSLPLLEKSQNEMAIKYGVQQKSMEDALRAERERAEKEKFEKERLQQELRKERERQKQRMRQLKEEEEERRRQIELEAQRRLAEETNKRKEEENLRKMLEKERHFREVEEQRRLQEVERQRQEEKHLLELRELELARQEKERLDRLRLENERKELIERQRQDHEKLELMQQEKERLEQQNLQLPKTINEEKTYSRLIVTELPTPEVPDAPLFPTVTLPALLPNIQSEKKLSNNDNFENLGFTTQSPTQTSLSKPIEHFNGWTISENSWKPPVEWVSNNLESNEDENSIKRIPNVLTGCIANADCPFSKEEDVFCVHPNNPMAYLQCSPMYGRRGRWTERFCPDTLIFIKELARCEKYENLEHQEINSKNPHEYQETRKFSEISIPIQKHSGESELTYPSLGGSTTFPTIIPIQPIDIQNLNSFWTTPVPSTQEPFLTEDMDLSIIHPLFPRVQPQFFSQLMSPFKPMRDASHIQLYPKKTKVPNVLKPVIKKIAMDQTDQLLDRILADQPSTDTNEDSREKMNFTKTGL